MRQPCKRRSFFLLLTLALGIIAFLSGCLIVSAEGWKGYLPAFLPLGAVLLGCAIWIISYYFLWQCKALKGTLSSLFFYIWFAGISLAAKTTNIHPTFSNFLTFLFLLAVAYNLGRLFYRNALGADAPGHAVETKAHDA